jgi:hypothetical protein
VLERADTEVSRRLQEAFFADIARRYLGFDPALAPSAEPDEVAPPAGAWVGGCSLSSRATRGASATTGFRSAGYAEIPAYNENPFASYWLEKRL